MRQQRLLPVCVFLALAPSARADFKDTYRKALEAVDRKRWPEVAQLMREAISQNPREGEKVKLYGLRFETYLPHFHLGVALSETGDCAGALRAFEVSEGQGAVRGAPVYAQLLDAKSACQKLAGPATPPPTLPSPPPTTAPRPTPTLPPTPAPTPTPTTAPVPTPSPTAMPTATPRSPPPPSASPTPASQRPGPPPPELVRAAEAYFGGRYDEAAALLDRITGLSGRPAAQAHLLRAAARFALFRIGGEQDATLRQRILDDVAACRRVDPALAPDPEAFPPPFADLFRGAR